MQSTAFLLLALMAPVFGGLLPSASLFPTQENFDKDRFMGAWYDIAMASSSLHHKDDKTMGILELQTGDSSNTISMTKTALRHGMCRQSSAVYELTETPGRMFYHTSFGTDVDAYVVHTNYDEYAIVAMSRQRIGDSRSTTFKLYGRTMELRPTLMTEFQQLVKEQGINEDSIIILQKKEKCVPGDMALEPEFQRVRRNVVLPTPEEGSGDDAPIFRDPNSCQMAPDAGPCFGMLQRFYYNSTLMACQAFTFGGCLGNQNNFVTEKECLQSCRTEAACRLPIDPGACILDSELWAFNSTMGKCVSFKYGGCQGNGNKFYSQKECGEYCGVMRDGDEELLKKN
ncbi:hypothetical protein AAFF_G00375390 [Aldrovandia affinis]|uniref:Protein AMBP n=1 Tax=Aldrovandia affinis TaxID=143900 RepID=A0AAD7SGI3_9TELE|nr:hypothetical protein AAFF_G00375390 [Aldrovandia affinis]